MKRIFFVHFILISLLISGCKNDEISISSLPEDSRETIEYEETDIQDSMSFSDASECVYLCGAIKNTGVYYFTEGQRLWEIVKEAGGLDEDADTDAINMAAVLKDGEKIRIPYIGESISENEKEDSLIDINTANADELCTIPGIGPSRANAIIAYREEIGGRFENIEQLKEVSGIKDGSFNKIKPYICVK